MMDFSGKILHCVALSQFRTTNSQTTKEQVPEAGGYSIVISSFMAAGKASSSMLVEASRLLDV